MNVEPAETGVLRRFLSPTTPFRSKATAKELLSLKLSDEDAAVMSELAEKARAGTLTPDDTRVIEMYTRITSFISIVKIKARVTLRDSPKANPQRTNKTA